METQWTPDAALAQFGFAASVGEPTVFLHEEYDDGYFKHIIGVTTADGRRLVLKFVHEFFDGELADLSVQRDIWEKECAFASFLRENGVLTPKYYRADGHFCIETVCSGVPCTVTVEDYCGEEIREITEPLAFRIGALVAGIHMLSLAHGYRIGCNTLFSAAEKNDVDCMDRFRSLAKSEGLDHTLSTQIETWIEFRRAAMIAEWDTLPKSAVQGDISINNLIDTPDGLLVFDYNNAGDVVLVSDLVLEGLLTAYEMDLPENTPASVRERLFPAFLNGYLSVRTLSEAEQRIGWEIYTLYHALWFSRVVYNEDSLEKLLQRGDLDGANALLRRMLDDIMEPYDGRFARRSA